LSFSQLDANFTAHDIAILKAYDSLYILGDKKEEVLAANHMALLANVNRGRDSQPFHALDFMLGHKPTEELSEEESTERMRKALGG